MPPRMSETPIVYKQSCLETSVRATDLKFCEDIASVLVPMGKLQKLGFSICGGWKTTPKWEKSHFSPYLYYCFPGKKYVLYKFQNARIFTQRTAYEHKTIKFPIFKIFEVQITPQIRILFKKICNFSKLKVPKV